jgi:hypothetical protein
LGKISKVLEINNCNRDNLIEAIYKPVFWEITNPTKRIEVEFIAPNVLYSKIYDEIDLVRVPIEIEGELLLENRGIDGKKGHLIEFNVRNNKDVHKLEGRIRVKALSPTKSKVGIFIEDFKLGSEFLSLIGGTADLILQSHISDMLRKLEKFCKSRNLKELF